MKMTIRILVGILGGVLALYILIQDFFTSIDLPVWYEIPGVAVALLLLGFAFFDGLEIKRMSDEEKLTVEWKKIYDILNGRKGDAKLKLMELINSERYYGSDYSDPGGHADSHSDYHTDSVYIGDDHIHD